MRIQLATGLWMEYDDVGGGRPVVLLHAFPLDRTMWRPQLDDLQKDYRLIAPDLRGFGGTQGFVDAPSVEGMADDVAVLLHDLHIEEPVVLGGLSMGGYVALAFARKYPDRLLALILADTRAEADTAEAKANRDKMIEFAGSHPARAVIDQLMPKMVSAETQARRPEVVEEVRRIAGAQTAAGVINALRALRDRPDASLTLDNISVPALVIVGDEDQLTPPALSEKLVAGIRNARLATIPGAGHLSNLEQPARFSAALRAFLQAQA
jgi:pimeloyl-ACP methyl ester carboxylesterase